MQDEKKVYGFTLSLYEYIETIPTLWDAVKGMSFSCSCGTEADNQNSLRPTRNILPTTMR
jgi:hypothetical protein